MLETAISEVPQDVSEDTDDGVWIEALPARIYHTPQYGEVPVTVDKLERMIHNFHQNVRGQEIATDYEHGLDSSKGLGASGWYRDFEIRPSSDDPSQLSLYAKVELTEEAKKDIKDKRFKYWSLEWDDDYETDTGDVVPDVIIGGGLTNRPVAKRTMPINFSEQLWDELDEDTKKQFAVWTTKYVNSLPDSSFLYIDDNGRHLPYKDKNGKIDLPHLRNAAARVNQIKGISSDTVSRIKAKIQRLLKGTSKASELAAKYDGGQTSKQLYYDALIEGIELSEAAMEHSDPGVGVPLNASANNQPDPGFGQNVPRVTGDPADDDPAIGEGWRRDPLPVRNPKDPTVDDDINLPQQRQLSEEGGNTVSDFAFTEENVGEIRTLLDLDDKADGNAVVERVRNAFSELKQFKDAVGGSSKEKQFAEMFPQQYEEHQELLADNRKNAAKTFAESHSRINRVTGTNEAGEPEIEPTRNGLSALAIETIEETHRKFSEGTATLADLENVVSTITNGGIVEFGEVGSNQTQDLPAFDASTAQGRMEARRLFAEKVAEVQAKHAKDHDGETLDVITATSKASEQYPDLAAAYRATA